MHKTIEFLGFSNKAKVLLFLKHQVLPYFAKAIILIALLTIAGISAPSLPTWVLGFVIIVYALISTVGALYYAVIRRLHKQYKLTEDGQLAAINRKWLFTLCVLFIVSIASGFLFILQSPKWNGVEWSLTWFAVLIYFIVFFFVRRFTAKEFAPKFIKANTMLISMIIVGILLALIYAFLASYNSTVEPTTLAATYDSVLAPFKDSPSALFNEIDKINSLPDGVSTYATTQASGVLPILSFVFNFIIYFSVLFGLTNQFSACLLTIDEIKSEFKLLPDPKQRNQETNYLKRYFIALGLISLAFLVALLVFDKEAALAQATEEHTVVEAGVANVIEITSSIADGKHEEMKEAWEEKSESNAQRNFYLQEFNNLLEQRQQTLLPMLDNYYDQCLGNVDSFLDWKESPPGSALFFLAFVGEFITDQIENTFEEKVIANVDSTQIKEAYANYQQQIDALLKEAGDVFSANEMPEMQMKAHPEKYTIDGVFRKLQSDDDSENIELILWEPLMDSNNSNVLKNTLLNMDAAKNRDEYKAKLVELINTAHAYATRQCGGE